jgi:MIP family channel proteins
MSKKLVAEAIGTFALCFVGILAIGGAQLGGAPAGIANLASIGLAHGLTIAVMIAALGAISGAHFNPAVTFGFVVARKLPVATGVAYWAAQLVGATLAGGLLAALFGTGVVAGGTPDLGNGISPVAGAVVEAVLTFFLVLVVFGAAVDERAPKSVFPFAIGFTVALDIMAGGPISGAAMNPARTFGPALASGHWANHLVYWVGPLVGGAAAALLHTWVLAARAEPAPVAVPEPVPAAKPRAVKRAA